MNELQRKEIQEAIEAADNALYHLDNARRYLGSAGNWGLLDLFGGGMLSGMIKHSKMRDAEYQIEMARDAVQRFSRELQDVSGYTSIHIDGFLTFADFFFDGFLADVIVQSKISDAKRQCEDAIRQVERIRGELISRLQETVY